MMGLSDYLSMKKDTSKNCSRIRIRAKLDSCLDLRNTVVIVYRRPNQFFSERGARGHHDRNADAGAESHKQLHLTISLNKKSN